jgi:hypothetical protein
VSERSAIQGGEATPDPTRSETRLRVPADGPVVRASRPSVRPSAFGPPRPSTAPPQAPVNEVEPPGGAGDGPARKADAELPQSAHERAAAPAELVGSVTRPVPPEPHARVLPPYFATALTSLRPAGRETPAARGRRPLFSIAVFCSMLALSGITLLRYALPSWGGSAQVGASERARPSEARHALQSEAALAPQPRVVVKTRPGPADDAPAPVDPSQERASQLLALRLQGERALVIRQDLREAEELFSRMLELEDGNARAAFGMARVRLAQGNLSGAEGWIQLAISKRPRRAPYHALYAQILSQLGREDEALEERLRAAGGVPVDEVQAE